MRDKSGLGIRNWCHSGDLLVCRWQDWDRNSEALWSPEMICSSLVVLGEYCMQRSSLLVWK